MQADIIKLFNIRPAHHLLLLLPVPIRAIHTIDESSDLPRDLASQIRDGSLDTRERKVLGGARARLGGLVEVGGVGRVEGAEVGFQGEGAVDGGLEVSEDQACRLKEVGLTYSELRSGLKKSQELAMWVPWIAGDQHSHKR